MSGRSFRGITSGDSAEKVACADNGPYPLLDGFFQSHNLAFMTCFITLSYMVFAIKHRHVNDRNRA